MNEKKLFSIGTVDEFMESITLIQTRRASRFPVILVGSDYWKGLVEWMKETMAGTKKISESDLAIFRLVDDPQLLSGWFRILTAQSKIFFHFFNKFELL